MEIDGSTEFNAKFSISVFLLHAGMQDDQHQSNVELYRQRNRSIHGHVPVTVVWYGTVASIEHLQFIVCMFRDGNIVKD